MKDKNMTRTWTFSDLVEQMIELDVVLHDGISEIIYRVDYGEAVFTGLYSEFRPCGRT